MQDSNASKKIQQATKKSPGSKSNIPTKNVGTADVKLGSRNHKVGCGSVTGCNC